MSCAYSVGGGACTCRRDTNRIVAYCPFCPCVEPCAFVRLANVKAGGRARKMGGVLREADSIRKERFHQLKSIGLVGVAIGNEVFEREYRVCKHHFEAKDFASDGNLVFGARARAPNSVQVMSPPQTPNVRERVLKRSIAKLDDCKVPEHLASPVKLARTAISDGLVIDAAMQQLRREMEALRLENKRQVVENSRLRKSEKHYQDLYKEAQLLNNAIKLDVLRLSNLPEKHLPALKFTHWSYRRLCEDPLMSLRAMELCGFPSPRALGLVFNLMMAYTRGRTPKAYDRKFLRPGVAPARLAHEKPESRDASLNKFFFALWVLRTGPQSITLAGINFGFDKDTVSRWYPAWMRATKLFLVHHFPPLDRATLLRSTPGRVSARFPDSGGAFDATEREVEVPFSASF